MLSVAVSVLFGFFLVSVNLCLCEKSCAYFKTNSTATTFEANSNVTLTFTLQLDGTCGNKSTAVKDVRVFLQEATPPHTPICQVLYRNGSYFPSGCMCDPQSQDFTVTRYIDGSRNETWILSGHLQSGEKLPTVKIQVTSSSQSQSTTAATPLEETTTATPSEETTTATPFDETTTTSQGNVTTREDNTPSTTNSGHGEKSQLVLFAVVVLSVAAVLVFISLAISCSLQLRSLKIIKNRRSSAKGTRRNGRIHGISGHQKQAVTPDVLYRGSNVSLMVTNDIYESSDGFLREGILGGAAQPGTAQPPGGDRVGGKTITAGTSLQSDEKGHYVDIDTPGHRGEQGCSQRLPVLNGGGSGGVDLDLYVDVEDIKRRKAEQRKQKEATSGGSGGVDLDLYVDVEDIKRRKAEQRKQKEATSGGCGGVDLYVDVEDIKRRKAEQRKQEAARGACGGLDLYVDVEDIKRRKVEQRKQKAARGEQTANVEVIRLRPEKSRGK